MSSLTKSLEKRIQELTISIDSQKIELAAYEKVLAMETGRGSSVAETSGDDGKSRVAAEMSSKERQGSTESSSAGTPDLAALEFSGNKTNLVAAIVEMYGAAGAAPKEVDAVFTDRGVAKSKNLIYNTLSYLVTRKKLVRKDGRYFAVGAKPSTASTAMPETGVKPTRRKMSAEGIKRIREANKKRWEAKRAADASALKAVKKTRGRKKKTA